MWLQAPSADENYLRESILQSQAKLVMGYPAVMPVFQGQISEENLMQLIAYIKSLKPATLRAGAKRNPCASTTPRPRR